MMINLNEPSVRFLSVYHFCFGDPASWHRQRLKAGRVPKSHSPCTDGDVAGFKHVMTMKHVPGKEGA